MTGEGVKDTEPWVKATSMQYAYAYDKGGKLFSWSQASGYPSAFLVDASGKVVWEGHPSSLTDKDIEKAVIGALPKPLWDWPTGAKDVRTALMKRAYADALAKAGKLVDPEAEAIKAAVQGVVSSRVANAKAALAAGDFFGASTAASELMKQLDGLPEKAEIEKVAADIKANKDADKIIRAQKKVAETGDKKLKRKDIDGAIADMQKIVKELPGTFAAQQAKDLSEALERSKRKE